MSTQKQPEALRLAELFEQTNQMYPNADVGSAEVAAELRRLHALNQELLEALKFVGKQMHYARDAKTKADYSVVRAAIAKAGAACVNN